MKKIFFELDKNFKFKYIFLLILIFISILIELLSFSSLIPLFNILLVPFDTIILKYPYIYQITNFFNIYNQINLILFTLIFVISLFTLKFIFFIFFYSYESKLLYQIQFKLSQKVYKNILYFNYRKFLNLHSSEIVRNITAEVNACISVFNSINILIVEISLSIMLVGIILVLNKSILIPSIFFILIISIFYLFILKRKLKLWGVQRQQIESSRIKLIYEGTKGIKELKTYNLMDYFLSIFKKINFNYSDINRKQYLISQFPRVFLEMFLVIFVFSIFFILINSTQNINEILITIGIIAAFSFRLLPSANKIIINLQNLKFYKPSLNVVNDIISHTNSAGHTHKLNKIEKISNLDIKNLQFGFKSDNDLFENLNISILENEHIGIFGESGIGKTTLIDIVLGLIKPTKGKIIINGNEDIYGSSEYKKLISYVPQNHFLINDTILNNINFGYHSVDKINYELINDILEKTNLKLTLDKFEKGIETYVDENGSNFSIGQIQRIIIARALYREPKILILDEPTSALDSNNERNII